MFSDEFTGGSLDTSKWTARDEERGQHSDGTRWWYKPENLRLIPDEGGNLAMDLSQLGTGQYGGARIDSAGKFEYTHGTLEARVHTPAETNGHLAAVWLQSDNMGNVDGSARDGAEIDITETAHQADTYPATIHWDGYGDEHQSSSETVSAPGLHSTWYHTYGLEWTPTELRFLYDGNVVRTVTDPNLISQVNEYPILSHEILEFADGVVQDAPLDSSSTVYVDYIRIWQ